MRTIDIENFCDVHRLPLEQAKEVAIQEFFKSAEEDSEVMRFLRKASGDTMMTPGSKNHPLRQ